MMSENQKEPQYKLRWSEELRDKVVESAKLNSRSINAEICIRLEQSFKKMSLDTSSLTTEELFEVLSNRLNGLQITIKALDKE